MRINLQWRFPARGSWSYTAVNSLPGTTIFCKRATEVNTRQAALVRKAKFMNLTSIQILAIFAKSV